MRIIIHHPTLCWWLTRVVGVKEGGVLHLINALLLPPVVSYVEVHRHMAEPVEVALELVAKERLPTPRQADLKSSNKASL